MDPVEQRVRQDHPDWTDEQVAAEVARINAQRDPPEPSPQPDGRDAAFAEMRRRAEAAEREAQELRDAEAERQRRAAEEQGEFERLYHEERARREALEAGQAADAQRRAAEAIAADLRYQDVGYALYLLTERSVDLADTGAVRSTLEAIARDRPELVSRSPPPPSGGPAGGSNADPPRLTAEDLRKMTPQQVAALDPKVVSEALAAV